MDCRLHQCYVTTWQIATIQLIVICPVDRSNQRPNYAQSNWTMVPSTEHGRMLFEETDMNTENIDVDHEEPPVIATTNFTTPEFSVVIENSTPEHPAEREAASQSTAFEVSPVPRYAVTCNNIQFFNC